MALKIDSQGPGGIKVPGAYRRAIGILVNDAGKQIEFRVADYADEAARQADPSNVFGSHRYQISGVEVKPREAANPLPDGKIQVIQVEGAPSYDQFVDQPISAYLPECGPATTLREILGAIKYGYVKTRQGNAGAVDA